MTSIWSFKIAHTKVIEMWSSIMHLNSASIPSGIIHMFYTWHLAASVDLVIILFRNLKRKIEKNKTSERTKTSPTISL